jgi:serralysin
MAFGVPTASTTVAATGNNNIDGLLSGVKWASNSVSFSFTDSINDYESGYENRASHGASFQTLNASQRAAARAWIGTGGAFYNISNLSPYELTGANDRDATIRMARSNDPGAAYAYYPGNYVEAGDAWFNNTYHNIPSPAIGNYGYLVFGHELGHALGLKHGHETGGVRNVAMNSDRDSMEFSIMTYRSYVGASTTSGYTNETWGYAQSLMMYDIAAIQHMYGAWFGYNSGNTTYTFSTTTGEMFVNGVGQGTPGANRVFRTIWDGNGIDTYDFSNYSTNLSIDLTPGGWSDLDVGGNFQSAYLGGGNYARGQVFNALQYNGDARSLIENANGGSGNDTIKGNSANNVLNGNSGNDNLNGGDGNDTIYGGAGNDTVDGGNGNDLIYLGDGNDYVNIGSLGNDTYYGGNGNDYIYGYTGNETYYGEDGNDTLLGSSGNDFLNGGAGNDSIDGGSGDDNANGGDGNDTIYGGAGNDTVDGGNGNDLIYLGDGNDYVNIGSLGNDTFYGGNGNDYIYGYTGNETYYGEDGNDTLLGYSGNDSLNGGVGNDTLIGGADNDTLTGGAGADQFTFYSSTEGIDTITDFLWQEGDKIAVSASGFGGGLTVGSLSGNQFTIGSAASTAVHRFIYNSSTGAMFFDIDGTGGSAQVQFATVSTGLPLISSDILVIA